MKEEKKKKEEWKNGMEPRQEIKKQGIHQILLIFIPCEHTKRRLVDHQRPHKRPNRQKNDVKYKNQNIHDTHSFTNDPLDRELHIQLVRSLQM